MAYRSSRTLRTSVLVSFCRRSRWHCWSTHSSLSPTRSGRARWKVGSSEFSTRSCSFCLSSSCCTPCRSHSVSTDLLAEPFLVVALIAVIRRVLVITAEIAKLPESSDNVFRHAMWELGVMTAMILVLVGSLIMLQKYG